MKQLIKFGLISGLVLSNCVFASDPVQGVYLGLFGEISHAPNTQLNFITNQTTYNGQISLGPVGGGAGGSIGYRMQKVRIEAELLFNINSYSEAKIGSCTLVSPTVLSPQGICPDFIEENGLAFNGNTTGIYGLFNVFYDFISSNPDTKLFPYIGFGLGGAQIRNTANIQNNQYIDTTNPDAFLISISKSASKTGIAIQGIIGISSYLDDYATFGVDFRYLSTVNGNNSNSASNGSSNSSGNSQYGIATLNLTATFALDKSTD